MLKAKLDLMKNIHLRNLAIRIYLLVIILFYHQVRRGVANHGTVWNYSQVMKIADLLVVKVMMSV